jgi:hypothetical protein
VPSARPDHLGRHLAQRFSGPQDYGSRPGQHGHEPVGIAGLAAPHHAGQHQVARGQVTARVGQVGGVDVLDRAVQARHVRQQPQTQTRHAEQVPYAQGITSRRWSVPAHDNRPLFSES